MKINKRRADEAFEKFTWMIKNFSVLDSKELYSENFFLSGHAWRIVIYPKGNGVDYLSIYLEAKDLDDFPECWTRPVNFKLALINQVNGKLTKVKGIDQNDPWPFSVTENAWGYTEFTPLDKFCGPSSGFIVNDTCIIEARICVSKSEVDQTGELIDFKGLREIEKTFVPLLGEVCSWHPSLVDCQRKRRHKYTEFAFTTLGEVLHFLKTKKVKDMNDDGCNHLQNLWEELETFRFDLSWLEPHFQHALEMKGTIKRGEEMKRMEENVAALEMELEVARRELMRVKEGFEERHLDAKLGYGGC